MLGAGRLEADLGGIICCGPSSLFRRNLNTETQFPSPFLIVLCCFYLVLKNYTIFCMHWRAFAEKFKEITKARLRESWRGSSRVRLSTTAFPTSKRAGFRHHPRGEQLDKSSSLPSSAPQNWRGRHDLEDPRHDLEDLGPTPFNAPCA